MTSDHVVGGHCALRPNPAANPPRVLSVGLRRNLHNRIAPWSKDHQCELADIRWEALLAVVRVPCSASPHIEGERLEVARSVGASSGPAGHTVLTGAGRGDTAELPRVARAAGGHAAMTPLVAQPNHKWVMLQTVAFVVLAARLGTLNSLFEVWAVTRPDCPESAVS